MDAIVLRSDLRESLEKIAGYDGQCINDMINEAVEDYIHKQDVAKIDREIVAYEAMHLELRQKYFGHWVAVHNGELVDHDPNIEAMYRRVRDRYGQTAVLIRQVKEQPVEEVWVRTRSMGKVRL